MKERRRPLPRVLRFPRRLRRGLALDPPPAAGAARSAAVTRSAFPESESNFGSRRVPALCRSDAITQNPALGRQPLSGAGCPEIRYGHRFKASLSDRPRRAEQVALHLRAAFGLQDFELLLGLHAFGGRDHAEAAAQARDRANDCQAVVLIAEFFDERTIDLDFVEREAAQVAQR